jgi:hypothetical protein
MATKMTPEEKQAKIAQLETRLAELESPAVEEPGMLENIQRKLNLVSGAGRAAVAGAIEPLIGKDLVSIEQVKEGTVPSTKELIKQSGIDPLTLGGGLVRNLAKLTGSEESAKEAILTGAGIVGDIGLDPSTYVLPELAAIKAGKTLVPAAKVGVNLLETLLNPVGTSLGLAGSGIKKGGEAVYKSAFSNIDRAIKERTGKGSIGDLLHSERFAGSFEDAVKKIRELSAKAGEELGRFREYAANRGVMATPSDFSKLEQEITRLRQVGTPEFAKKADYLQSELDALKQVAPKYPSEVSQTQATLRSYLPKNAWALSSEDALKTRGIKGQMAALASAEEQAMAQKLNPEDVADFIKNKERYGLLQETRDLVNEAKKEASRTGANISSVDAPMAGYAALAGDPRVAAALAAKKLREIARLSSVRTKGGLMIEDLGSLVGGASEKIPPQVWMEMLRSNQGEQQ